VKDSKSEYNIDDYILPDVSGIPGVNFHTFSIIQYCKEGSDGRKSVRRKSVFILM